MATKPKHEKGKRWGKKREDKRIWPTYNEELVVRGMFLLDFDWVLSWDKELEEMNIKLDKVAYKFEVKDLERRVQTLERKIKLPGVISLRKALPI